MLPKRSEIKEALILLLKSHGTATPKEAYAHLEKELSVSEKAMALVTPDGEIKFRKEVRWVKKDLVDDGTVKRPHEVGRGVWELR
jgi:5-methylcytosine-specific restriction enzyme A